MGALAEEGFLGHSVGVGVDSAAAVMVHVGQPAAAVVAPG